MQCNPLDCSADPFFTLLLADGRSPADTSRMLTLLASQPHASRHHLLVNISISVRWAFAGALLKGLQVLWKHGPLGR